MIRLQKKTEQAKKEQEAKDSVVASTDSAPMVVDGEAAAVATDSAADSKEETEAGGLSLLGIGGKQIKGGAKKATKKRTPGEIRIQKGKFILLFEVQSLQWILR
jgi:hypothetical protein